MSTVDLLLGNDNLEGVGVRSVGYRVVQDADSTHNLAGLLHFVREIRGIADDSLGFRNLFEDALINARASGRSMLTLRY